MPRCPDCNLFVSVEPRCEVQYWDIDDVDDQVTSNFRIIKDCAECGSELEDYEEEVELDFNHECPLLEEEDPPDDRMELVDEPDEIDVDLDTEGSGRYMKTFYVAHTEVSVKCKCGHEQTLDAQVRVQASWFNQLY